MRLFEVSPHINRMAREGPRFTHALANSPVCSEGIGRILAALDAKGLADNTLVVFTSDNGGDRFSKNWPFVGGKMDLLEGCLRVPLVARWPACI